MTTPNEHIDDFLDHYYEFPSPPEYAVLLKGSWGSGKSWFIQQSLEKLSKRGGKYIYVSLYGMTSYEEIEGEFFKQLHPVLSSKGMALAGKVAKGLLNATLKIDLNGDGKSKGSFSGKVPDINIPEYLTNTEGFVLIFDDLERCSINLSDVLGYINHFVENQGYKVVVIANEDEILEREKQSGNAEGSHSYKRIKEKLIGKTFGVEPDLVNALNNFISSVETEEVRSFYIENSGTIKNLYRESKYNNLRHLKQSLWDFERIYKHLPQRAQEHKELLHDLLQIFFVYSFEIKSGSLCVDELSSLRRSYMSELINSGKSEKTEESLYRKIANKYVSVALHESIIEESIWQDIIGKGLINKEKVEESIQQSRYFISEKTPTWIKLWHMHDLTDEDFDKYFSEVSNDYFGMNFEDIGVIKHVTGMFLRLTEIGLYKESKNQIIDHAKTYISNLKEKGRLVKGADRHYRFDDGTSYAGLQYQCLDTEEFKGFSQFVDGEMKAAKVLTFPEVGEKLLDYMVNDTHKFYRLIVHSGHEDCKYYDTPVLAHVSVDKFVERFLSLHPENKQTVSFAIKGRYEHDFFANELTDETEWLTSVKKLLEERQKDLEGKLSGYINGNIIEYSFAYAIRRLAKLKKTNQKNDSQGPVGDFE